MTLPHHQVNPTHDVTPAQAGAHPEIAVFGHISGWVTACAGMTPRENNNRRQL